MAISRVQQGVIGEQELAKLIVLGTDGRLEIGVPLTDDERRDTEVHRRGEFTVRVAIQAKTTLALRRKPRAITPVLSIHFTVPKARVWSDPRFLYFFGRLDRMRMFYEDPVFLVPSDAVHRHASPALHTDTWHFTFAASMGEASHDKWAPYRVSPLQVGRRLLEIMRELPAAEPADAPTAWLRRMPGFLWIRRA